MQSTQDGLLSPDDITKEEQYRANREKMEQILTEAKRVVTPKEALEDEKKGDFTVIKYEWMESQMDKFHPRRSVKVIESGYDTVTYSYSYTVEVVDLTTGESRCGASVHPAIIYEQSSEKLKSPKKIRQQLVNAKRAALTEAMRDAYAHFGIASDYYKTRFIPPAEPKSKDQIKAFNAIVTEFSTLVGAIPDGTERKTNANKFMEKWIGAFQTHNFDTADAFIEDFKQKFVILKEKLNEQR